MQYKKLNGKKVALILLAEIGAAYCDLTSEMFIRIFNAFDIVFMGVITSQSYDVGDAFNDASLEKY